MRYSEDYVTEGELFHFVGRSLPTDEERYALLTRRILRERALFRPQRGEGGEMRRPFAGLSFTRTTLEDSTWDGDLERESYRSDPQRPLFGNIVCFADIPFDKLGLHVSKYSRFGLSFTKRFLAERGARPVLYYPVWKDERFRSLSGATSLKQLQERLREIAEGRVVLPESFERDFMMQLMAFVKPFDVELKLDDPENYYTEREWRLLGVLNFQSSDVLRVIVPEAFEKRLQSEFPDYAEKVAVLPALFGE